MLRAKPRFVLRLLIRLDIEAIRLDIELNRPEIDARCQSPQFGTP